MPRPGFDIFAFAGRMMAMDEDAWARHASPASVYSRMAVLPLLTLAVLSRAWLGWLALLPAGLVAVWAWWNPRAFPPPSHTDTWAARGTFGERVFLNRHALPVPARHSRWAHALSAVSAFGALPWAYGLWAADAGMILFGLTLMMGAKLWFVDRMVWLYQDMKDQSPEYAGWLR